ncbi:DNA polymerase III subunit beta [Oceanibaculum indicum]|uniref:Beta sliding clamp n=1 Tax=Oceanibaculum indicum TaxID=526216 RepID=A0A420WGP6_9PROT|nr:DNA polymerase III subunit beta [Oceanibaculum indicum]RKQ70170.1 DNA polymerase III sliding clamp (beta) subunit (PCNA family) [Oceanibaculum indicum]
MMPQITVSRNDFSRAVAIAGRAIERRITMPALQCIRVRDGDGCLTFSGTDLDIQIDHTVPGMGGRLPEGGIAIRDFRHIGQAAKAVSADTIEIGYDENAGPGMTVNIGRLEFCGVAYPGAEFQAMYTSASRTKPHWTGTLSEAFLAALKRVRPAISTDTTRYYLNGVYFEKDAEGNPWAYNLIATDGHRLHRAVVQIPDASGQLDATGGILLPRKLVTLLLDMRPRKDTPAIGLAVHPKHRQNNETATETLANNSVASVIRFQAGNTVVTGKPIDGTFPDYRRVIPQGRDLRATFDRAEMMQALKALTAFGGEKADGVLMEFTETEVSLSRSWSECSATLPGVPCKVAGLPATHSAFCVRFNTWYLVEALTQFTGCKNVTMAWPHVSVTPANPCAIGSDESTDFDVTLMPMRF